LRPMTEIKPSAQRVGLAEVAARHRLIDQRRSRSRGIGRSNRALVWGAKIAAGYERHAERLKKPPTHRRPGALQVLAGVWLITLGNDGVGPGIAAQEAPIEQAGCPDARKRFESREQFLVKRGPTRRVRSLDKIDIEQDDIFAVEPGVQPFEMSQRAQEQACANEQHQRKPDLRDDNRLERPLSRSTASPVAGGPFERTG